MLSIALRKYAQGFLNIIAHRLHLLGFTPNSLTILGFLAMCSIGLVLANGYFALGGILIVLAGLFDALDGSLARLTNQVTRFGAFLDSTTDRLAEGALLLGLLFWYLQHGVTFVAYLIYLTLLGSLVVSYARARAEGIGVECKEGLLTRFERIALLVIGLVLSALWGDVIVFAVLGFLAVFTNVTAFQRIWIVYRAIKE